MSDHFVAVRGRSKQVDVTSSFVSILPPLARHLKTCEQIGLNCLLSVSSLRIPAHVLKGGFGDIDV